MSEMKEVKNEIKDITIRDAVLYFRNFAGEEGTWNSKGDRNFGVFLNDEDAEALEAAGWNVKKTKPNEEGYCRPFIKVKVNFKGNPRIYMVTSHNKQILDEETVGHLDHCIFEKIDLKIRHVYLKKYDCFANYLDKGFFTIVEDDLDREYFGGDSLEEAEDDIPFN